MDLDRRFWDERWAEVLETHADQIAQRPPNPHLTVVAGGRPAGRALDAGCGHGSEALWLAGHGWHVTAVDFSPTVLAHGRATADALGADLADRLDWVEGDLGVWAPEPAAFDLVSSLYVHVAGSVEEFVARLAAGVAPGGLLLLVGHLPIDPETGAETAAAGQVQVTVDAAMAVLDPGDWELVVAEDQRRTAGPTGFDAVIQAVRRA